MPDFRNQPLQVLRPNRPVIQGIALRITAVCLTVVLLFALMLTFAGRFRPLRGVHATIPGYAVLGFTAILIALAVIGLAQVYVRKVSIGVWPDALAIRNLGGTQRTIALNGLVAAERVPVTFKWLFWRLHWKYVVLMWRPGVCIQTLDAAEWSEAALERVLELLRAQGVPVRGDWSGKPVDLVGSFSSLGVRYPGATRLRSAPYSLLAVACALLCFGAGLLASLPFSIG